MYLATADEVRISLDTENDTQSAPLFRQWDGMGGLHGAPSLALPETVVKALLSGSIVREGGVLRVNWTGWPQTVRVQGVKGDSQGRGSGMWIDWPARVLYLARSIWKHANISRQTMFSRWAKRNRFLAPFSC
jgi:hypothetical protein